MHPATAPCVPCSSNTEVTIAYKTIGPSTPVSSLQLGMQLDASEKGKNFPRMYLYNMGHVVGNEGNIPESLNLASPSRQTKKQWGMLERDTNTFQAQMLCSCMASFKQPAWTGYFLLLLRQEVRYMMDKAQGSHSPPLHSGVNAASSSYMQDKPVFAVPWKDSESLSWGPSCIPVVKQFDLFCTPRTANSPLLGAPARGVRTAAFVPCHRLPEWLWVKHGSPSVTSFPPSHGEGYTYFSLQKVSNAQNGMLSSQVIE